MVRVPCYTPEWEGNSPSATQRADSEARLAVVFLSRLCFYRGALGLNDG